MPLQTPEQKKNAYAAAGVPLPSGPITGAALTPTTEPVVQTPQVPAIPNVPSPLPQPVAEPIQDLEAQIAQQLGGSALQQRTEAATAPLQAQLGQLDARIAGFDAAALKRQEEALNSGETLRYSTGLAGQVARTDAIERLTLIAQRQAISGDIAAAERTTKIAVDAEFDEQEKKNETLRQNLMNNYDSFSASDKKRADAALLKLDKDDAFVAQQKEDKEAVSALAIATMRNFPNDPAAATAVQQALRSNDLQTAFQLLGQYQADPNEIAQQIAELNLTRAQKAKVDRESAGGGASGEQLYSGLSSSTSTAVRSKVTKFSSEPIVQNFATIQEGHNFAQSISDNTTNPADDQALIYSLAKALDPGSVVREGEYATAQKYSQSWIDAYGKGVTQAIAGTGFLSVSARKNIKKVIAQKYDASKRSYDNTHSSYTKNINSLTGRDDGSAFLVDYATEPATAPNTIEVMRPDGVVGRIPKADLAQAFKEGYRLPAAPMSKK